MILKQSNQIIQGSKQIYNFHDRYLDESELQKPDKQQSEQLASQTKNMLDNIVGQKTMVAHNKLAQEVQKKESQIIKYTPSTQTPGYNMKINQRIIKMHTVQKDPLAPAQFKHKRIAPGPGSPPAPINHSPKRKITAQDQLDWKIPPCVSNWKNAKGYTIPLEIRLKADGRQLKQQTVNEKHTEFTNAIYMAERANREELEKRNQIQNEIKQNQYLEQQEKLRQAAQEARQAKENILKSQSEQLEDNMGKNNQIKQLTKEELEQKEMRDDLRYIQKREAERDARLKAAGQKKAKQVRDLERDISEKVALGQAQPTMNKDSLFDQRLFNQTSGLDAGFGSEDENRIYDKPLFQDRTAANIYQNIRDENDNDEDGGVGEKRLDKILVNQDKIQTKGDKTKSKGPVQFIKQQDPSFASVGDKVVKKVKKN